jgi:uncharacterized protein DUF2793
LSFLERSWALMDQSPNLTLPYIMAAQAQKHVTHNEAIRELDAIVQLAVKDRDLSSSPVSPANGDRYIVAANATGDWFGKESQIAAFQDNAWVFYAPNEGWLGWVADEGILLAFDGTLWSEVSGSGGEAGNPVSLLGVNTTASLPDRLAVKSDGVLLSHDDVTPGSGDMRAKLNKNATGNTASLLFQTGFSGRAEFGLTGDDDWHVKVSPDGTNWYEAMIVDKDTGMVSLPTTDALSRTNLLINGDFKINQRVFSGGVLAAGQYGFDRWKAASTGADITLSNGIITLASGEIEQVIEIDNWGNSDFSNADFTVSVEAPSADLIVTLGGASATILAGSGRRSVKLTTLAGDAGNLSFRIRAAASNSVDFARVKLEHGPASTAWQTRPGGQELALCQRYFQKSYNMDQAPGAAGTSGSLTMYIANAGTNSMRIASRFPVWMRTPPALSIWSDSGAAAMVNRGGTDVPASVIFIGEGGVVAGAGGGGNASYIRYHFTADAEL